MYFQRGFKSLPLRQILITAGSLLTGQSPEKLKTGTLSEVWVLGSKQKQQEKRRLPSRALNRGN